MSTYSSNLRIELITTGTQPGTWGTTTNDNYQYVFEQAIAGSISVTTASADEALTYLNGPTATASANASIRAILVLDTVAGSNFAVYAPPVSKLYIIKNASSYTVTIYNSTVIGNTTAAGTGITVPAGEIMSVWSDGTNFYQQNTALISPHLSGTPTAPTAVAGTNTTQVATTAFATTAVSDAISALGTMAVQDANNVNITGGSITGITDLAVADGGTGASTASDARTNLGLGSLATLNTINNGNWSGTALALTNGGTGATDAAGARTALGLGSLATANTINNGNWSGTALAVANGGTGATDATTARTNLGLGSLATLSSINNSNWSGTALAVANGGTGATTSSSARTNLGLGTIATQDASNVSISGGSITGITDLAVADGGTGASTASAARTNLGVPSTTGSGASGTWAIDISGNAANGGVTSVNTKTGAVQSVLTRTSSVTTNGQSHTVSGIPSWAQRVTIIFSGVSTTGTSIPIIQIGNGSSNIITSGYTSGAATIASTPSFATATTGFILNGSNTNAFVYYGTCVLTLHASIVWIASHSMWCGTSQTSNGGGYGTISGGSIDRIVLTTVGGTDYFDNGSISVTYE